jgi:hypothetical protein
MTTTVPYMAAGATETGPSDGAFVADLCAGLAAAAAHLAAVTPGDACPGSSASPDGDVDPRPAGL